MKTYKIAYSYMLYGVVDVEAESLEEAKELAMQLSIDNDHNERYLDESFQIDEDGTNCHNTEY